MKIIDRLMIIKGKRNVSEWEKWAGIARGNLDRALKDGGLSDENIIKLRRADNINTNWLLCCDGSPYQISSYESDISLSEQLSAFYTDEAELWSVHFIQSPVENVPDAIVLTMPAEYSEEKKAKYIGFATRL